MSVKIFTAVLLIFQLNFCFSTAAKLKCREKSFRELNGCFLKKLTITMLEDDIDIAITDKQIEAVHIENEIVNFLPKNLLKFDQCKVLHVVNSGLKSIDITTFKNIKKLDYLNLEKNQLTELFHDTFSELIQLKFLNLNKNKIKNLSSRIFLKNLQLETLSLSCNEIEKIHENTFSALIKLEFLYLSNNKIAEIRDPTFTANEALTTIDLRNNKLESIGKDVFEPLNRKLKTLQLENNKCIADEAKFINQDKTLNLSNLKDELIENCLPFPIKEYQVEKNVLIRQNDALRSDLQTSKDKELRIIAEAAEKKRELDKEIENLRNSLESNVGEIKNLEIRLKRLSDVYDNQTAIEIVKNRALDGWNKCEAKFKSLEVNDHAKNKLEIEVQSQRTSSTNDECFSFKILCAESVESACKTQGVVTQYDNMTLVMPRMTDETLIISKSFILFLSQDIFKKFPKLRKLEIVNSNLRQIRRGNFAPASNLAHLEVSKNHLKNVPMNSFEGAEMLETLTLTSNKIETVSPEAFTGLSQLTKLNLNQNEITEILTGTFDSLINLKNLQLSYNRFHHLDGNILKCNAKLEILMINKNPSLQTIGESIINKCPKIREIYYGNISCVKDRIIPDDIEAFKKTIKQKCSV